MQWVEGLPLNQFVRDSLTSRPCSKRSCGLWARMARRLREADMAHGDLQHGNVLLVPGSRTIAGPEADRLRRHVGAGPGRPPNRARSATRPTSTRSGCARGLQPRGGPLPAPGHRHGAARLAVGGPALWERYDNGDNLLFREADLRAPGESALFRQLWRLPDPLARVLTARLALACQDPLEQAPPLTALVAEELLPVLDAEQKVRAEKLLGRHEYPVGLPAGAAFDFAERPPRRRGGGAARRPSSSPGRGGGFSRLPLAVALPLLAWLTAPACSRSGGRRPRPPRRVCPGAEKGRQPTSADSRQGANPPTSRAKATPADPEAPGP